MKIKFIKHLTVAAVAAGLAAQVAARTMTATPNKTANVVDGVTLAFGGDDGKTYALYVAYGATDAGTDISRWEHSSKVADIAAGTTSHVYDAMPYGWGFRYHAMRFFLFDPDAAKPFDRQLEYLKGDGRNYVVTEFTPTGLAAVEVDFKGTSADGTSVFCARSNSGGGYPFNLFAMANATLRFDYFGYNAGGDQSARVRNDGLRHRVRCDRTGISVDGRMASALSCPLSSNEAGSQLVLLAIHSGLNVTGMSTHTIYGFKGWTNASDLASLAIDLVPCVKDGVACFYDRVSETCLPNFGDGAFVEGPEVAYLGKTAAATSSAIADFTALEVTASLSGSNATVAFSALSAACRLVMAYGALDGGQALDGWENVQVVATLEAGATSHEVSMPSGWGDRFHFARFFLIDESNCPFDKQVAYVQGQGAQYIETGFTPTGVVGVEADLDLTSGGQAICCGGGVVEPTYLLMFNNARQIRWDYMRYNAEWVSSEAVSTGRHLVRADANRLFVDESSFMTLAETNWNAATSSMILFAKNSKTGFNSYGTYKLYSFKAWSNRSIIDQTGYSLAPDLDLLPCVKNGKAGLFNRVDGTFHGNSGTGSFSHGGDVVYVDAARLGVSDPLYAANGRTMAAKRFCTDGRVSRIDLTFGPAQSEYRLHAAFAATDCGDDFDSWTVRQEVTTLAASDTALTFTDFPEGWGTDYKFVRFFLLGDKAEACPYDKRVTYLKANIKQSILTDFFPTGKSAVEFEYDNQESNLKAAFCARNAGGGDSYSLFVGGKLRFDYYGSQDYYPSSTTTDPKNLGHHTIRCDKSGLTCDGVVKIEHDAKTTATGYPMMLFATHSALASETPSGNFALYWFKAWQDPDTSTQPALDLVPCVKNKEGCLYDRVGRRFLFNRTSTPFALGSDLPSEVWAAACSSESVFSDPSGLLILFR